MNTFADDKPKAFYFFSYTVFIVIINGFCMVAYSIIFYTVRKHIKETKAITSNKNTNWGDIKLSIYGFIIAVLLVIYTITILMMLKYDHKIEPEKYNRAVQLWTGLNDVFSGCNPWFIIMFSSLTREHMWRMITGKSEKPLHNPVKKGASVRAKPGHHKLASQVKPNQVVPATPPHRIENKNDENPKQERNAQSNDEEVKSVQPESVNNENRLFVKRNAMPSEKLEITAVIEPV